MPKSEEFRPEALTTFVRRVVTFTLADARLVALDSRDLRACSDYAKRFYPRSSLARAA